MDIRYNVPKDLIEYELYERSKKEERLGIEYESITRIEISKNGVTKKEPEYSQSSNMSGVFEYAEYERNKLKKYK